MKVNYVEGTDVLRILYKNVCESFKLCKMVITLSCFTCTYRSPQRLLFWLYEATLPRFALCHFMAYLRRCMESNVQEHVLIVWNVLHILIFPLIIESLVSPLTFLKFAVVRDHIHLKTTNWPTAYCFWDKQVFFHIPQHWQRQNIPTNNISLK